MVVGTTVAVQTGAAAPAAAGPGITDGWGPCWPWLKIEDTKVAALNNELQLPVAPRTAGGGGAPGPAPVTDVRGLADSTLLHTGATSAAVPGST
jgi:hypothetical protein